MLVDPPQFFWKEKSEKQLVCLFVDMGSFLTIVFQNSFSVRLEMTPVERL
jgi:hypothetical protein